MWIRRALRMMLVVLAVGAASVAFTAPASAHTTHHPSSSTVKVTGGKTVLTLDAGTAGVLTANGVKVAPIAGAYASGSGIAFPITGGKVTTKAAGTITHRGGLKFTAGHVSLGVQDFVIDTRKGVLTARVSGTKTRIPLLKLDLGDASVKAGKGTLTVKHVRGTLTKEAAAALNKTFGVKLFKAGLPVGTAAVKARF
jgi:Htaa